MDIAILGGGYAGQLATNRLRRLLPEARLTLIDARTHFVERTRLHEAAAGAAQTPVPLSSLVPVDTRMVVGRAAAVRPGVVLLDDGRSVCWDFLVLAMGSRIGGDDVPGVATHAIRVEDPESAACIAQSEGSVIVVGGGLTGIEMASELAESGRSVKLYSVVPAGEKLTDKAARFLRQRLTELGVRQVVGPRVEAVLPGGIRTSEGTLEADQVLWCAGFVASALTRSMGLPTDRLGRLWVEDDLRIAGLPGAVAAGDVAAVRSRDWIAMSCATAMPMGAHAADTIARLARGQTPTPFRFGYVGQCISLGRHDGVMQRVTATNQPRSGFLRGRPAAYAKQAILAMTQRLPASERALGLNLYLWNRPPLQTVDSDYRMVLPKAE